MEQVFWMVLAVIMTIFLQATRMTVWAAGCKPIVVAVNSASIHVKYETRRLIDDGWSLQAQVSWTKPSYPAFDGYAVQLNPVGSSKYGMCHITKDYVTTKNESIVFDDLKFGYQYEFVIHVAQLSINTMSFMKRKTLSWAPDCYEETQDKEFCQSQEIATVSKVVDAKIDCILNDNVNMTAYITWSSPLQVNGNLTKYDVRYGDVTTHPSTWSLCDAEIVAYTVTTMGDLLQSQPTIVNFNTNNLSSGYAYRYTSTSYNKCALNSTMPTVDNHTTSFVMSSTLQNAISSTIRARNTSLPRESDLLPEERARQQLIHITFLILGVLVFVAIGHAVVVSACYFRRRIREDRVRAEIDKECYLREVNCDDCEESKTKMLSNYERGQVGHNKSSHEPRYVPLPMEINEAHLTSV